MNENPNPRQPPMWIQIPGIITAACTVVITLSQLGWI